MTTPKTLSQDDINKIIKKFHRLENKGDLEVEDLLKILKTPDVRFIAPLKEMAKQYDWQPLNNQLIVPFASWVDAICLYLEKGMQGLVIATQKKDDFAELVLSVVSELPISQSIPAFIAIASVFEPEINENDSDFAKKFAYNLCDNSHRIKKEPISEELRLQLIPILKKMIIWADKIDNESVKSASLVPFRYIGTMADIDFIKSISFSKEYNTNIPKIVIKDIKKREI